MSDSIRVDESTETSASSLSSRTVSLLVFVISLVVATVLAFFAGGWLLSDDTATPAPTMQTVPAPRDANPVVVHEEPAFVQVEGTSDYAPAYRCAAGLVPVQVPVGQTVQHDGSTFKLDQTATDFGYALHQTGVTFTIQLPANQAAPAYIVNTAEHQRWAETYGQTVVQANLSAGGAASHALATAAYTENFYMDEGIIDITVCLRVE